MAKPIDTEMEQFQNDLLESVRQMKAGKAAHTTVVSLTQAKHGEFAAVHTPEMIAWYRAKGRPANSVKKEAK